MAEVTTAAIILAAGESRRMGRAKAYLPFRGGTFLSVLAGTLAPFCSPVIAVFGFDAENMRGKAPASVRTAVNPAYELGMLTSLQAGLSALPDAPPRILFTLVDHPAIEPSTVRALLAVEAPVVIPRFQSRRGHPVIISSAIAAEFLREPASSKMSDIIRRHEASIEYVDVDDPGVRDDIDDPAALQALLAREARQQ